MARAPEPIVPARLAFTEAGVPFSADYGDVYHAAAGSREQARYVFLAGNGLPDRWRGRTSFTVLETGFGLGLNFLETWHAARRTDGPARLHFVSIEKHPLERADLERVHAAHPELAPLARLLAAQWPPLVAGLHRLHFDAGRITLTLAFGDVERVLPALVCAADAIYLDGFSPAKNAAMWSRDTLAAIGRLARPGATAATWSVAAVVRDGLERGGFATTLRPGFAHKREMLVARTPGTYAEPVRDRRALVVGAGLAGTTVAAQLARRNWTVTLADARSGPAQAASGNPAGVVQPVLNLADAPNARLARAAFLHAVRTYASLQADAAWHPVGVLRLAKDDAQAGRFRRILARAHLTADFAQMVDAARARDLARRDVRGAGVWFPLGGWADPRAICAAQVGLGGERIHAEWNRPISLEDAIASSRDTTVIDATGASLDAAALQLAQVRGQVTFLPPSPARALAIPVTGDGYVAPLASGGHCAGASFGHDDFDTMPRTDDHAANLARASRMLPGFADGLDARALAGRVGFRVTSPDRIPVYGALGERRFVATALGARGLVWAPLCAELLASLLEDEPLPVERDLAAALAPARLMQAAPSGPR